MKQISQKIRPTLTQMEIGQKVSFPLEKLKSVRAQASELGLIMARRYSTSVNRQNRTISVTRDE